MPRKKFTYTVVFENDPETGYVCASFPALDLATHGRTMTEAQVMAREALAFHLEGLIDENIPIPPDVVKVERLAVNVPAPSPRKTLA